MKFPKTIRFDNSDLNIFENPSEEGEWAISGAFEFSNDTKENLKGKRKQSFSNGFLGLDSFGRSTFVSISSIDEPEKVIIVKKLAELGLRSISDKEEMKKAMVALKGKARIKKTMWAKREKDYKDKLNRGDPISVAEV